MDLIIDTTATDLTAAAVTSVTDDAPISALKQLVIGDSEPLTVQFTDGSAAPAWASDEDYILTVSLGFPTPAGIDELAATSTFTLASSTRTGSLSLTSDTLVNYVRTLIGNNPGRMFSIGMSLQIRIATPAGADITYAQLPVIVLCRVISPDVGGIATGIVALSALGRVIIASETAAAVLSSIGIPATPGDVVGPASSTDNAIARYDSTTGKLLQNSTVILSDNGDLSVPSTATLGLRLFNTVDQVTDFERLEALWLGDVGVLQAIAGGAGTNRTLSLRGTGASGVFTALDVTSKALPLVTFRSSAARASSAGSWFVFGDSTGTSTASGSIVTWVDVTPTIDHSGTAGYTALRVNVTETATGSGTKLLMQLGTAASASLFTVGNSGQVVIAPLALTQASPTAIDFLLSNERDITLAGDIEFTTSNLAAGRSVTVYITADGSERTFTFPAWVFMGTAPTTIAANKRAILELSARSTTDASVRAKYFVET